ncbi:MAG TPA: hypothetical protein VH062_06280 [Polyangiaceae bacterium]|jgi:hypothetical protein|nr:hypothetical protein [Polyangiaceae bacterium]
MHERIVVSVVAALCALGAVTGCASARIKDAAAANVGCGDDDATIGDVEQTGTKREFALQCKGITYRCTGTSESDVDCERADGATALQSIVPGAKGTADWATYDTPCGVRVDFPGAPVQSKSEVHTQEGASAVETETFEPEGKDAMMAVTCAAIGPAHEGVVSLLDLARNSVLAGTGAHLLDERPSIGGRELRYASHGGEALARFVIVGDRLLSLVVAPVSAFPDDGARRFLDSPKMLTAPASAGATAGP